MHLDREHVLANTQMMATGQARNESVFLVPADGREGAGLFIDFTHGHVRAENFLPVQINHGPIVPEQAQDERTGDQFCLVRVVLKAMSKIKGHPFGSR